MLRKYTYKLPHVQTNWKTEINQDKKNHCFELGDQNANKSSLEYVRVEEKQKDDNDGKENAYILNSVIINNNIIQDQKFLHMIANICILLLISLLVTWKAP